MWGGWGPVSHLKVLSLHEGVAEPRPLFQQAAAQVFGVHVEVPTQQNYICILGRVAELGEERQGGGGRTSSLTMCPLEDNRHPPAPIKPRLTHWMNWASSHAWATRCAK